MGVVTIVHKGDFEKTTKFFDKMSNFSTRLILNKYGKMGVDALAEATPVDTGKTAASWSYEIEKTDSGWAINWKNSNVNKGVPIAIILQYGHGTRNGGYVAGRDYINPALRPVFDDMAESVWKEVINA